MAGAIDGKMMVAGENYSENDKKIRTAPVDLFDPEASVWLSGAPLQEPRCEEA